MGRRDHEYPFICVHQRFRQFYTYGDDLISQQRGSLTSYYHYDGQLSTRQLTNAAQSITDEYMYDAFGLLLARSGSTVNHYMYTGEQYDPNCGFYYLRARYYNASIGRFHTMDTWPGMQFEPGSLHKYFYCEGNPANYIDPSGHMSIGLTVAIVVIGLALIALTDYLNLHTMLGVWGWTDHFKLTFKNTWSIGGGLGYGEADAEIKELPFKYRGTPKDTYGTALYHIIFFGFIVGASKKGVSAGGGYVYRSSPREFFTRRPRDLRWSFSGIGRLFGIEGAVIGGISWSGALLPDRTYLEADIGFSVGAQIGVSAYDAFAVWSYDHTEY